MEEIKRILSKEIGGGWGVPPKNKDFIWFWVIENIQNELSGMERSLQIGIIQNVKREALKEMHIRGDMRNLREKHIPRIKEIYYSMLQKYIIQE